MQKFSEGSDESRSLLLAHKGRFTTLCASTGNYILETLQLEELFWLGSRTHQLLSDGVVGVSLGICQRNLSWALRTLLHLANVFGLHLDGRHLAEVVR